MTPKKPKKMGRPRFEPTEEQRKAVRTMAALGMRQDDEIAPVIGVSPCCLRRAFAEELKTSMATVNARVGRRLLEKCMSGDTTAIIWWMKNRMGWTDRWKDPEVVVNIAVQNVVQTAIQAGMTEEKIQALIDAERKWNEMSLADQAAAHELAAAEIRAKLLGDGK